MYYQEREFRLSPLPINDDRKALNQHKLELPVWFYIRYPGYYELSPEMFTLIKNILPDLQTYGYQLILDRMPTLVECASLHQLATEKGCILVARQRPNISFNEDVHRARALRTGRSTRRKP